MRVLSASLLAALFFLAADLHRSFPTGHGFSQATAPEIKQLIVDHFVTSLASRTSARSSDAPSP